jgi:hypothetical protein
MARTGSRLARFAAGACATALAFAQPALAEEGYTTIFDGTATGTAASWDKWAHVGDGGFTLEPDGSVRAFGSLGMSYYTLDDYGDMSFKVDYKDARTEPGYSNGGVLIRSPDPRTPLEERPTGWTYDWLGASGPFPPPKTYASDPSHPRSAFRTHCGRTGRAQTNPAWLAIYCGQEVQINDSPDGGTIDPKKTGSFYNFADIDAVQSNAVERYPTLGVWHTMEIRTVGMQFTVLVDGKIINQWDGSIPQAAARNNDPPTMARQFLRGYIGLQSHASSDVLHYRNARVKELTAPPRNLTLPEIAGSGLTGRPLTCSPGTWANMPADATYRYEWFRSNRPPDDAPTQAQMQTTRVGSEATYTPVDADFGKVVWCRVTATNPEGGTAWATRAAPDIVVARDVPADVSGTVPGTLSLSVVPAASFGAFTAGTSRDYLASSTATVTSTAGDASLSITDPSSASTGHLVNGPFSLPQALQARATNSSIPATSFAPIGGSVSPTQLLTYPGPVSNDPVALEFKQSIGAADALRTGTYSKTLTLTLSTTSP